MTGYFDYLAAAREGRPSILRASRRKYRRYLAGSLIFVAIFAVTWPSQHSVEGLIGGVLFGLCAILFAYRSLVRGPSVRMDGEGFTIEGRRAKHYAWSEVAEFYIWKPRQGVRMVAYRLFAKPQGVAVGLARGLGADGGFGGQYELDLTELLDVLEAYRTRRRPAVARDRGADLSAR